MRDKVFVLFSCCVPTKGKLRSVICDLQRNDYFLIPNALYDLLVDVTNAKKSNSEIISSYLPEDRITISQYFEFLIENELGFWCDAEEVDSFPLMDLKWESPVRITNLVVDIGQFLAFDFRKLSNEIEVLGCIAAEFRFQNRLSQNELRKVLSHFNNSRLKSIYLIQPYCNTINYEELLLEFDRLHSIILYSSPSEYTVKKQRSRIQYISNENVNSGHCGIVSKAYYTVNLEHFTESQKYNSCLNRKISIDTKGNIKNCPSMPESFGNIKDTTLAEAVEKPGFKKYWNINKDKIHVCKDCEFRYICTDCRAYVEDPDDILSKPLKCGYNPYTGEWSEWSTNPLKQKAIDFYEMREVVKAKK